MAINNANPLLKITSVTPTLCQLMKIKAPTCSVSEVMQVVIATAEEKLQNQPVEKCLVYAPDALGLWLQRKYEDNFARVRKLAPIATTLSSMYPSKTPVCFASMFTGAEPKIHGIKRYEKPVLTVDTIFDSLVRAGKKTAIVAVKNSSIDVIFRDRNISYYSEEYDNEAVERAIAVLADYDFVLVYNQEYDDAIHSTTPESDQALQAMHNHIKGFDRLAEAFHENWKDFTRAIAFTPDHGTHIDEESGRGTHGSNSPDDILVQHFYGVFRAGE